MNLCFTKTNAVPAVNASREATMREDVETGSFATPKVLEIKDHRSENSKEKLWTEHQPVSAPPLLLHSEPAADRVGARPPRGAAAHHVSPPRGFVNASEFPRGGLHADGGRVERDVDPSRFSTVTYKGHGRSLGARASPAFESWAANMIYLEPVWISWPSVSSTAGLLLVETPAGWLDIPWVDHDSTHSSSTDFREFTLISLPILVSDVSLVF
nr:hypothetical protein Iba_chr09dCG12140 [Ipomoea batatas]